MKKIKFTRLYTNEGKDITSQAWDAYPRPQMKRDSFFSLNGPWELRTGEGKKEIINVPFPPESILSGINRDMGKYPVLHYRKVFTLPKDFIKDRVLLHFGAVDQYARVKLNGTLIGEHRGGYEPFTFDITRYLQKDNVLKVVVTDQTERLPHARGKQRTHRTAGL